MKRQNVVYIRVLLVVLSVVILLAFINHTPKRTPQDTWLPSSFNPVGAGNMALFQTLQDLNWPVERWREPLGRLSNYGTGNVLVITRSRQGMKEGFSEQEIDLLDDWVKKGNTLLLLGALGEWDDTRSFLQRIGFTMPGQTASVSDFLQPFEKEIGQTLELQPAAGSNQTGTMILPTSTPLPFTFPQHARILWQVRGSPYFIDVPRGAGHIICGASDRLLSNAFLPQGDNLAIVLGLLAPGGKPPRHLFFEEGHHGFSAIYAMVRLLGHPGVRFAGMLALLGALTFLGTSFVRFGPVIPLHHEMGRSTLEFVDSIADLYQRADLRNDTIKYLFVETHQRVLHRFNLPPTASHELIASRLQQANPHLPKWKKLAQRFDSRDYVEGLPPTGWLRVAKDLIEIKSAMA
ncbi:MAG: DUF4350 domain-containing protein [Methylacidiphilales bacterium]|nr:DUF4350 domain-containing protein [Candidatus Methylacidiphilales bacterium]